MQSPGHRKKGADWRNGPAFLDATSSVSASTFGARRLPELKNLYFQTRGDDPNHNNNIIHERQNLLSGGGKRSSRHLRRRTTAIHSKRHRHRYPTTDATQQPAYKGATRKARRKKPYLLEGLRLNWLQPGASDAADSDETARKFWQVTHRWHSKRFHLLSPSCDEKTNLGGWTGIPLVHTNRGARAALRLSQNKDKSKDNISSVMVRDVTWERQPLMLMAMFQGGQQNDQEKFLLQQLGTICPGLLQPESNALDEFLSGKLSVDETVYDPNSFPSGAIGPAVFRMLPTNGETMVEIRCHPSIRSQILEILEQLSKSTPDSISLHLITETMDVPRISFRLYGTASVNVLNKIMKLSQGDVSEFIEKNHSSPTMLSHGATIRIAGVEIQSETPGKIMDDVILVYKAPRPLDCPANCAMAGWEVLCSDVNFGKALWLAMLTFDASSSPSSSSSSSGTFYSDSKKLTNAKEQQPSIRGCCAIGLVEDCHMRLECEPPIPLFPRDYVDTQDSQKYWMSSSSSLSSKRIRQLCEGGWGRLPIDKESRLDKLEDVDFSKLVALDNGESEDEAEEKDTTPSPIVTVRGAFGQPFVDAIRGSCGNYSPKVAIDESSSFTEENSSTNKPETKKRRRNRRPTRPKNQPILAPSLSKESRKALGDYCHKLSSSLRLPAVLLVHVRAMGNGRIAPGMAIVCADSSDHMLGRITAGGFSTSRGICHGIGVIGAVRLLDYVHRTTNDDEKTKSYGRIVRLANGSQSLQLLVRVANIGKDGGCEASISALI